MVLKNKICTSLTRGVRGILPMGVGLCVVTSTVLVAPSAQAFHQNYTHYYGGDFNDQTAFGNGVNTEFSSDYFIFEDFEVAHRPITVTGLFSNNLMNFSGVNLAQWQIRTGVTPGYGGEVVAGGWGKSQQLRTGMTGFGLTEYTVQVLGLEVDLDPGTYWFTVAPVGRGVGRSYLSVTSGSNAVGTPIQDNRAFYSTNLSNSDFNLARHNFSQGVFARPAAPAAPVPVPPALLGTLAGLGLTALSRRRIS
jgi:hypothetical protein